MAFLCLTCLFPVLKVSAQQKDDTKTDQSGEDLKSKRCDTKQTAKVVLFGQKDSNIDPCKLVEVVGAGYGGKKGYKLFTLSNDVINNKLTESQLTE